MNHVYLRGCEKAYLGDLVDVDAYCPKREPGERKGAGSLVVHIRSGDIFDPNGEGGRRNGFGQVLNLCVLVLWVRICDGDDLFIDSWTNIASFFENGSSVQAAVFQAFFPANWLLRSAAINKAETREK